MLLLGSFIIGTAFMYAVVILCGLKRNVLVTYLSIYPFRANFTMNVPDVSVLTNYILSKCPLLLFLKCVAIIVLSVPINVTHTESIISVV